MSAPLKNTPEAIAKRYVERDGCWIWSGTIKSNGYGTFQRDGRRLHAHRVFYEMFVGPIPVGLAIDHLCRNRACVNPFHLEPVTNRENLIRGTGFAAVHSRATACPSGHRYSATNTKVRRGRRYCAACDRISKMNDRNTARRAAGSSEVSVCPYGFADCGDDHRCPDCAGDRQDTADHALDARRDEAAARGWRGE